LSSVFSSTPTVLGHATITAAIPFMFGSKFLPYAGYKNGLAASEGAGFTLANTASNVRLIDYGGITFNYCPVMEFRVL
jgi:hypothetical protein